MDIFKDYSKRGQELEGMNLFDFMLNICEGSCQRHKDGNVVFMNYLAGSYKEKGWIIQNSSNKVVPEMFEWPPLLHRYDIIQSLTLAPSAPPDVYICLLGTLQPISADAPLRMHQPIVIIVLANLWEMGTGPYRLSVLAMFSEWVGRCTLNMLANDRYHAGQ
jgi:hypothetical protein